MFATNWRARAMLTSAGDVPDPGATKISAHATIHPTANRPASAECSTGSIAVNQRG